MHDKHLAIDFTVGSRPGHRIAKVAGQLCLETVGHFQELMRADSSPVMILDLRLIDFLDSTGVGALVRLHVGAQSGNRKLALADLSVRARAALEVSGLMKVLAIFSTVAEAEQALG